jgi:hypothetical protein
LFFQLSKHDTALKMVELAVERIKGDDTKRRVELVALKQQILDSAKELEERRRRHASRAAYHGGKLPVEIFGEIFGLLVASDVTQAIVVSHVCKHWRAVAISTPYLWRTLVLAKKDPGGKTREWTKRSQSHIRELCVRAKFEESNVPLSSALLSFPWSHLRVCRLDNAASLAFYNILADLSLTRILTNLVELEHSGLPGNELKALFLDKIPNSHLRSLTINRQSFGWGILSDLTKLVSLVIRNSFATPGGDLLGVLEANPTLETIVLDLTAPYRPPPTSLPLTLSRLTHLEIASLSAHYFCDITMASLRILRITRVTTGADTLLRSILDRGPVILTELSIQSSLITSSQLIPFLRAALSLETFELSYIDEQVNAVVEALARRPSLSRGSLPSPLESFMCPLLAHVKLSACPDLKTGAIMRLVRSRLPAVAPESSQDTVTIEDDVSAVAPIETLIVDKCPLIEPEVLPWLRSRVRMVSCVYSSGKDAKWKR